MRIEDITKSLENIRGEALALKGTIDDKAAREIETGVPADFMNEFYRRAMSELDIVSSERGGLETELGNIAAGLRAGMERREAGVRAEFERARIGVREAHDIRRTEFMEAQRGLGVTSIMAAQQKIERDTDRNLKDLDLREQQALAMGQTETANQIANLKIQAIQFREQAKERAFNNLLQMGQMGLQFQTAQRQAEEFEFRRATETLNLMKEFNLAGKIDEERAKQIEGQLRLKEGSLNRVVPKVNERALQFFQDGQGNVTGIFQDENTGAIRTQIFRGIGKPEALTTKGLLTQTMKNRLVNTNPILTPDVSEAIQHDLNRGKTPQEIIANISLQLGITNKKMEQAFKDFQRIIRARGLEPEWIAPQ